MQERRSSEFPNLSPMPENKAVLEETHDEKGTCVRTVSLAPDGSLRLDGHDLGPDDDLISALEDRFHGPGGSSRFEAFLASKGIESEFWSRVGD